MDYGALVSAISMYLEHQERKCSKRRNIRKVYTLSLYFPFLRG